MKREESATSSKAFIRCWRHSCLVLFFLHQHHNNEQVPLLRKDWYVGKLSGFIFLLFNFLFIVTWSTRWSLWHFTNRFFFFYSVLRWEVRIQFLVAFFLFHFYWPLIRRLSDSFTTARSTIRLACGLWPRRRRRNAASLCSRASLPIFSFNHY